MISNGKRIYWANSLFSQADREFNAKCAEILRKDGYRLFLPQELMANDPTKHPSPSRWEIFNKDTSAILSSDLLIACIDQETVDSGVACEIGIAYTAGIPIIALYTDFRQHRVGEGKMYKNPYIMGAIEANGEFVESIDQLRSSLPKYFINSIILDPVDHFSKIADKYSAFTTKLEKNYHPHFNIIDIVEAHLIKLKPEIVFEFGCGDGKLLRKLGSKYKKTKFIGYDSDEMIKLSRKRNHFANVEFLSNWELIEKNHSQNNIDFVMLLFSLHDNIDQLRILSQLSGVLKPNAHFLLLDLMQGDLPRLSDLLVRSLSLPLRSPDFRLNVENINAYLEAIHCAIDSINLHTPKVTFIHSKELLKYIRFFGIDKGYDLPLGLNRNYGKFIKNIEEVIVGAEYPFLDQRIFGEFLFKKQ